MYCTYPNRSGLSMDMNKLLADFASYISRMTDQQLRQSMDDAMCHSIDSDTLLTPEEMSCRVLSETILQQYDED